MTFGVVKRLICETDFYHQIRCILKYLWCFNFFFDSGCFNFLLRLVLQLTTYCQMKLLLLQLILQYYIHGTFSQQPTGSSLQLHWKTSHSSFCLWGENVILGGGWNLHSLNVIVYQKTKGVEMLILWTPEQLQIEIDCIGQTHNSLPY